MKHFGIKLSLFLIYFVFAALLNSVGILVERSQAVYDIARESAAILEPFKDLSIALVSFFIGSFLPKIGYKRGMLVSLFLVFTGCVSMYFADTFTAVKILFAITGMTFAVVKVAVYALVGYVSDTKNDHSKLLSLIETVFMLGIIFMYVVFPLFYDDSPDGWLRGYLLMAGLVAISFVIILFSKFDITGDKRQTSVVGDFIDMFKLFKSPLTWIFALFAFFYVMTEQGIMTWLPTFNKETLGIDAKLASQIAVLLMISFALGRFITGLLVKRIKWLYIAIAGVVLASVIVLTVLPLAQGITRKGVDNLTDLPLVAFLFPLIGLFLAPLYPLVSSAVLSSMPKRDHSSLAGMLTFFSAVGGTVGSLVIGFMFDSFGGDKVFYLSLIPMAAIFILLFRLNKLTGSPMDEII